MINIAFRLLLTFNATSLLVIVFLVQKGYSLGYFFKENCWLVNIPNAISYGIYFSIPVLLTGLSILLSTKLGKDEFKMGELLDWLEGAEEHPLIASSFSITSLSLYIHSVMGMAVWGAFGRR